MQSNIRASGIDVAGNIPWGTHFCQFCQKKEDLLDILVPYFKSGLENNEFCVWITSRVLNAEEVKEALKKTIPDFDIYLEKGQIEITPCANWYLKEGNYNSKKVMDRWIEKFDRALAIGYEGVRVAEDFCKLEKESWNDFVNYEKILDSITCRYPVIVLCTYSLDMCSATDMIDIVANHQFILARKEGKWEKTENVGRKNTAEYRQIKKALQESEKLHNMLFTHMTDGFGLVEVIYNDNCTPYDYRYLEANPAFGKYLDVDRGQILGRTMLEIFPNVSPRALEKYHDVAVSGNRLTSKSLARWRINILIFMCSVLRKEN
jgi:PAS domain-containing protein